MLKAAGGESVAAEGAAGVSSVSEEVPVRESRPVSLRELEMQAILEGLERNRGNKPRTAEELGISLKTLYNKLHQLAETQAVLSQSEPAA